MIPDDDDRSSSEAALVARAKAGDQLAFQRLIETHAPRLLKIATATLRDKSDAEEAVQDALAQAWLKLDSFDSDRRIEPWLARITLNKARDLARRMRWRRLLTPWSVDDHHQVSGPDPVEAILDRDLLRTLERRIADLPASLREAFVLVTIDGRSQAEAAEILDITEKAVETRIYRARNGLRKIIADR
jgi:RNA polymerase sigma factor CnrH